LHTQKVEQLLCNFELLRSPVIAKGVVAIADVSPGPHDAVGTFLEGPQHVRRAYSTGAHHPQQPHVGRILHPAYPRGVGACIRAPVAGEDYDPGVKTIRFFLHVSVSLEDICCRTDARLFKPYVQ
jgi:hypothetical protein